MEDLAPQGSAERWKYEIEKAPMQESLGSGLEALKAHLSALTAQVGTEFQILEAWLGQIICHCHIPALHAHCHQERGPSHPNSNLRLT